MEKFEKSDNQHIKKAMTIKNAGTWFFIAGVLIALIIAVIAGLHYFRAL